MSTAPRKKTALAFLTNVERILLYLRDDRPDIPYPNYWALLGGNIEEGESPEVALERELREEIGCSAHNLAFIGTLEILPNPMGVDETVYVFQGNIGRRLEEMKLTEGQRLAYFTPAEFLTLRFPPALRDFLLANAKW
jgi:8-oxo-dGTP diphosphatase